MSSLLKVLSLTPEQRRLLWRKQLADSRSPAAWLDLLRPLPAYEVEAGGGCLWIFLLFAGTGLTSAGLLQLNRATWLASLVCLAAGVLLLAVAIAMRVFFFRGRHLGPVLNPLLAVLREDMNPNEPVTLQLDLRAADRKANEVGSESLPAHGSQRKIVQTTYAHTWLTGEATLGDGTKLAWNVTDFLRRTRVTKRNARGKTKLKTKLRVLSSLRLQIGLRNDRRTLDPELARTLSGHDDGRRTWFKLRRLYGRAGTPDFDALQFARVVADIMARTTPVEETT